MKSSAGAVALAGEAQGIIIGRGDSLQPAYDESLQRHTELLAAITADSQRALDEHLAALDDQYRRRVLVRTLFADFEGWIDRFGEMVLTAAQLRGAVAPPGTEAVLRGETYRLADGGVPEAVPVKARLIPTLKFFVRALSELSGQASELDCGGSGYQAFRQAQLVRDRLAHPKSTAGLQVSDAEMIALHDAFTWWLGETGKVFVLYGKLLSQVRSAG